MFNIRKVNNENKYKVYHIHTGKVYHIYRTKEEALKDALNKNHTCNGYGFFDNVKNNVKNFANKLINGRSDLSPKVQNILNKIGEKHIFSIIIGRRPITGMITKLFNFISSTDYDKLFHLFMILTLVDGTKVLLEKNESINMEINPRLDTSTTEWLKINKNPNCNVNALMDNTRKAMGETKFIKYSGYDNNCQIFIISVLQSNNIHEGTEFIKQSTEEIFNSNPHLRKFVNTITDIGERINIIKQGGSNRKYKKKIYYNYID